MGAGDLGPGVRQQLAAAQPGAPLRRGTRLTGTMYDYDFTGVDAGALTINADLGAPGRRRSPTQVNFAPDGEAETLDDNSTCTGTYSNPTAPRGKVCVYLGGTSGSPASRCSGGTTRGSRGVRSTSAAQVGVLDVRVLRVLGLHRSLARAADPQHTR